jgi:type III secretory pathway component EscV
MDEDIRDEIARLEERIEALNLAIDRCRKISFAAKVLIITGTLTLVLMFGNMLPLSPALFFATLAAIIGGVVLLGSNKTTWEQMDRALHDTESMRTKLIEGLDMRLVGNNRNTLH